MAEKPSKNSTRLSGFTKYDADKVDLTILPWEALEKIAEVMMHGAEKYDRDNWRKCEDTNDYLKALSRHLSSIMQGDTIDSDSGLSHIAHIGCNALFLLSLTQEDGDTC